MLRRGRRRWDEQPTDPCAVLLASDGRRPFSAQAVDAAIAAAGAGPVAVVTIARIHGTQFGLPNPGLMPTKHELRERNDWVGDAVDRIKAAGVEADGQIASTRKPTKTITRIARARRPARIVIDETPYTGLRRFVEGDVGTELSKRLRADGIDVEIVPAGDPSQTVKA